MKALLLNGVYPSKEFSVYEELVINKLKNTGLEVENLKVSEHPIRYCAGCFNCWFVTPGECVFDDYGREIIKKICQSDLLILFSVVTFGGHSSCLKKILDRCIPLVLPIIVKTSKRERHAKRYLKLPNVLGIGITCEDDNKEAGIFKKLINSNAINFISDFSTCIVINTKVHVEDASKLLDEGLKEINKWD